jgi:hypothetical protein
MGQEGRRMTTPKDTLIRRALRRFALGSGPLKRRSDHVEAIGRFAVVLSFLVAPPLAVLATTTTTAHLQSVAAVEAADRSLVRAVLLDDAPGPAGMSSADGDYSVAAVPVPAVWSASDGTQREVTVLTEPRTPAGTAVRVWVDRQGGLTRAPLDRAGIPAAATAAGVWPLIGVPLLTWTLHFFLCLALNAHREGGWARDWATVEPKWNSRSR